MFDIGWTEMLVIAIVMIVVVGPKDLPRMLRSFGRTTSKLRSMAGDFQKQFNEALKEAELDDVKKSVDSLRSLNPANEIRKQLNPFEKAAADVRSGLDTAMKPTTKTAAPAPAAAVAQGADASAAAPAPTVPGPSEMPPPPTFVAEPAPSPATKPVKAGKASRPAKPVEAARPAAEKPAAGKAGKASAGAAPVKPAKAASRTPKKPSGKTT